MKYEKNSWQHFGNIVYRKPDIIVETPLIRTIWYSEFTISSYNTPPYEREGGRTVGSGRVATIIE